MIKINGHGREPCIDVAEGASPSGQRCGRARGEAECYCWKANFVSMGLGSPGSRIATAIVYGSLPAGSRR